MQVKRNGDYTTLAEDATPLHDATQPVALDLRVAKGEITFAVNGRQRFKVSATDFPCGRVGLMTYACLIEVSHFDVQVTD